MNIVQRLDAFGSYSRSLVDSISVEDLAAQDTLHRQGAIRPGCDPSHPDTNRFVGAIHNCGNARDGIFDGAADYAAFERVLAEVLDLYDIELFAYCLMPNHWHLVLCPRADDRVWGG